MNKSRSGFTIVELLIVIVVIGILAAITIVAYSGIQSRANDTKRAQDFANIKKALQSYEVLYGGVPKTHGLGAYTNGVSYSGWDSSRSPHWLGFLRTEHGMMPVDPINTIASTNDPSSAVAGNFTYFYHCYDAGTGSLPATDNVRIGYHKADATRVVTDYAVADCL